MGKTRFFSKHGHFTAVCILPTSLDTSSGREMLAHAARYKNTLNKKVGSPCILIMDSSTPDRHPMTYCKNLSREHASLDIIAHRIGEDGIALLDQSSEHSSAELAELLAKQFGEHLKSIKHIRLACCNSATIYPGQSKSFAERLRDTLCSTPFNAAITISGYVGYIGEFKRSKHSYCCDTPLPDSKTRYHRASECEVVFCANGATIPAKRDIKPILFINHPATATASASDLELELELESKGAPSTPRI